MKSYPIIRPSFFLSLQLSIKTLQPPFIHSFRASLRIKPTIVCLCLSLGSNMGLLEHLWDDTVAGPRPEAGLGKLRKSCTMPASVGGRSALSIDVPITRSITIIRTKTTSSDSGYDSASSSPSASVTPDSPLTPGTPRGNWKRTIKRKSGLDGLEKAEPRSPTVYDWVVISALDR